MIGSCGSSFTERNLDSKAGLTPKGLKSFEIQITRTPAQISVLQVLVPQDYLEVERTAMFLEREVNCP